MTTSTSTRTTTGVGTTGADRAFFLLRTVFTVAPILFGLDKFFNVLVDWPVYLAPWVDDIVPLLTDDDPLGVDDFATHRVPLSEAPDAYEMFQKKRDGAVKVVFQP